MIYFKGCVVREKLHNISKSTEILLNRTNTEYEILKNEKCCGSFLLRTGFVDDALQIMGETLQDIQGEKILVSCAGCYNTLKNDYKNILDVKIDVVHTSQFFCSLVNEGKLSVKKIDKKVTYHDPCHLGRHCGEYEAPRKLLNQVADLVEMERNREGSMCCGSGGGFRALNPKLARKIAKIRLNDASEIGADYLTTTCSFCNLNLNSVVSGKKKILDISEIMLMGLNDE
ncbi:heterodisulfide reductase-related iron-sulfur binding cluster [uncultured Methanobacterium sp.]|uniref:(Fe-S)-binding protein n=1 Tax=uncultured Methanobacterium sp. TaxID=176306 RepID=UPI002AA71835|nr:heterodisulfide reductase-related iron-sulfur binding cluster [uncultured Methanobacterium sp.]